MKRVVSIALSALLCSTVLSFSACEENGTITPHVHDYVETVVNPTCTEKGYTKYVCECGDEKTDNEVPATGHSYTSEVVDATCLADGYTKHTCACGDTYNDTATPKNPNNHKYESVVVPATCQDQGYTEYTCECGETYKDTYTAVTAHSFTGGVCACGLSEAMLAALTFNEYDTYCEVAKCNTEYVGEMIIPATYNGKPVTRIGVEAFNKCKTITSVKIPEGVKVIGKLAFNACKDLTTVDFPTTMEEFGAYAFSGTGITSIELPSSLKIMKTTVFSGCNLVTTEYNNCCYFGNSENPYMVLYKLADNNCASYTIHQDTTIIYDYVFRDAVNSGFVLNGRFAIPDGITSIGDDAFPKNARFQVTSVPSSLLHLGKGAFSNENGKTNMGVQQDDGHFMGNEENPYLILVRPSGFDADGKYVVKPETKFIYEYAFNKEKGNVKAVEFHENVLEIGAYAFYECTEITEIVLPKKLTELSDYMFNMSSCNLTTIVVPASVKQINEKVFSTWALFGSRIYFEGSKKEWEKMYVYSNGYDDSYNVEFAKAPVYFYSEQEPPRIEDQSRYDGLYWHYVEGVRTWWGWGN